ncbi:hypothetical protein AAHA92_29420 [Salvia divinorum]|uniref:Myb/SANT-like domain-containing protein n=1 Tax=Salvia divinorum TaxID=28513 RepID=A0ABD1FYU6_SALDI
MNLPPQATFLYEGLWTQEIDTTLVDTLVRLKRETGWLLKEFPSYFLLTAGQEIRDIFGVLFNEEELSGRVETLHARYKTFKEVLAQPGAHWDFPTKSVIAPDIMWEKICKKNPFVGAYYYQEKPQYNKLACLMGMDDIKLEGENEVIVLSDTTEKLSSEDASCYEVSGGTDEVNSPLVIPPSSTRRKLFSKMDDVQDRESTTEMGIYFIEVAQDGQLRTRVEKSRVLPKPQPFKVDQPSHSMRSSNGSSCGSNSPIGWWQHLQK